MIATGITDVRAASAYVTLKGADILLSAVMDAVGPVAFSVMPKPLTGSFRVNAIAYKTEEAK